MKISATLSKQLIAALMVMHMFSSSKVNNNPGLFN